MFSGVLAAVRGDENAALRRFRRAVAMLAPIGSTFSPGALYLEGLLEGGEQGRSKCNRLVAQLEAEGWADPQRALHFRVPGLRLLESR